MEARPCPIAEFLNGTRQMMIPLFQRPYEWGKQHWNTLWDDIMEQYEKAEEQDTTTHFTGAIVTAPARSVPIGVSKYLVIDGQQRLTTVILIICALRSLTEKDTVQYRKLTKLLINEDDSDLDYYKLLPTQPDRLAFQNLINEGPALKSTFTQAYDFFRDKINGFDSENNRIDIDKLTETIKHRLTVVSIHLGDSDDPYLIFESLNAKGAPLTQADLIRNYVLLRLHSNEQQNAYDTAWLPMQNLLVGDNLTEFMRYYLMQSGEEVSKSSIYSVLKKKFFGIEDGDIISELKKMHFASTVYANIVGLNSFYSKSLDTQMKRLRRWEIATAYPFILKLMVSHAEGNVSTEDATTCLSIIESFAVRRTVCNVPTNQLKRIFLSVAKDMPNNGTVSDWLRLHLSNTTTGGRRWPKDNEFREALFNYRAYSNPQDRCKFILESIEIHLGHKEAASFDKATIEHIMPQSLTDTWVEALGANAQSIHERLLDVIGNLTLTGYNSEISNSPFPRKLEILSKSNFVINKWIIKKTTWGESEINERTEYLFDIMREIWPHKI